MPSIEYIRYKKWYEEYLKSEERKCECPRCLTHKVPTSILENILEKHSVLFWLFSYTRVKEVVKYKCVDCWTEFKYSDIALKQLEFKNKYIDKHKNYQLKIIPTSLWYEYNWEIIYL